ncbi:MAG: c-type cytochrome [Gemmatimonas sp.]|nr:c-type cytochrome [Gemmatimonas sp.]
MKGAPFGSYGARIALLVWLLTVASCLNGERSRPPEVLGGDVAEGRALLQSYTCGECHVIPGVSGATGLVGPPLTDWVERTFIAGTLWNTPENLIRWLMDPEDVEPGTNMPDMEISEEQARHMAAYLYTLGNNRGLGPPHLFPVEWLEKW